MKTLRQYFWGLILLIPFVQGCDTLTNVANTINKSGAIAKPLTEGQIASGLKEALSVGISNGVKQLMQKDGYFGSSILKILLPKEVKEAQNLITKHVPNGQNLLDNLVLKMNRAAEDAANEATPIFKDAITGMSINDAKGILFGSDSAATSYLKSKTQARLTSAYAPKINSSLGKVGATQAWKALADPYNKFANSTVGKFIQGVKPINADLGSYVTNRALSGLFYKVKQEEGKIRDNPVARVTSLLQRVFGELDKKKN
ncbi:DUF4197 domain-containing protein [uncultured Microscilla sp.]|uniref:DUF4197 domain-containing protein n=1 Tax=uncultured Microscilla sp. TaxID=432653 RepID=UPI002615D303|nr:DUF4197 domain-containing protein [uncultured Microscilla sp.]